MHICAYILGNMKKKGSSAAVKLESGRTGAHEGVGIAPSGKRSFLMFKCPSSHVVVSTVIWPEGVVLDEFQAPFPPACMAQGCS